MDTTQKGKVLKGVLLLIIALRHSFKEKEIWIRFPPQSEGTSSLLNLRISQCTFAGQHALQVVLQKTHWLYLWICFFFFFPLELWNFVWLWELENNQKIDWGVILYLNFGTCFIDTKWKNISKKIESPH